MNGDHVSQISIKLKIPLQSEAMGLLMDSGLFWRRIGSKMSQYRVQVTNLRSRREMLVEGDPVDVERFMKWYEWMILEPD